VRVRTGQDVRDFGSGNVGAKNVGRILGSWAFLVTVIVDCAKGAFAVWAARHFTNDPILLCVAVLAVAIGHVWPVQLHFRGGKGIATSLAALLVYDFHLIAAFLILFAAAFAVLRKTVLPGLLAFVCLPFVSFYLDHNPATAFGISVLAALVVLTHRKNLFQEIFVLIDRRAVDPEPKEHEL
jgi:glycerol-3-phosphate acyltransferase PlsY